MVDWVLEIIHTEGIVNNCHGFGEKLHNCPFVGV